MSRYRLLLGALLGLLCGTLHVAAKGTAEKENVEIRVHYMAQFAEYVEGNILYEAETILDIGKNFSCFYGLNRARRELIQEKILAQGGGLQEVQSAWAKSGYPSSRFSYKVWKNYPQKGTLLFIEANFKHFRYTEKIVAPKWSLLPTDTIVAGYRCQQAEADYLGRHWRVAYTTEIPTSEGPWKLHGLPGLILHAAESEGYFVFDCIEIEQVENEALLLPNKNKKYVDCTPKEYHDLKLLEAKSLSDFFKRLYGHELKGWDQYGNKLTYPEKTAVLLER